MERRVWPRPMPGIGILPDTGIVGTAVAQLRGHACQGGASGFAVGVTVQVQEAA